MSNATTLYQFRPKQPLTTARVRHRVLVPLAAAVVLVAAATSTAQVVVPSSLTSSEACANNLAPFSSGNFGVANPTRYQQVYAASEFAGVGPTFTIGQISFRGDSALSGTPCGSISDLEIRLSTTSAAVDGLNATFDSNVGSDETLVYDGAFSDCYGDPGTPRPFDLTIVLQTPFNYSPADGNLLVDIRIQGGATSGFYALDAAFAGPGGGCGGATPDTVSRNRGTVDNDFTTGDPDTIGLVTQFDGPVPVTLQSFDVE